ncbi:RNase H family protein [Rhodoplanes sp. SY1]|uniref:RNase H family protein n=1 Tax=Rhodoplanes sp. SY1 TaxID=3166646 RepID=UPI0038B59635
MFDNSSAITSTAAIAYTAGHSLGVHDRGGWAVIVTTPTTKPRALLGRERFTTEARQQLTATIEALRFFKRGGPDILVVSPYVARGITAWETEAESRRFRDRRGDLISNVDLWRPLFAEIEAHPYGELNWGATNLDPLFLEGVARMARDQALKTDYLVQ